MSAFKSVNCSNSLCKENAYFVFQEGGGGLGMQTRFVCTLNNRFWLLMLNTLLVHHELVLSLKHKHTVHSIESFGTITELT